MEGYYVEKTWFVFELHSRNVCEEGGVRNKTRVVSDSPKRKSRKRKIQGSWKIWPLESCGMSRFYGLLTKCEVKMAVYSPSSFFYKFMDRDEVEVHKLAKKERGQYPAILTEQTWSIKDLLYGFRGNFACGSQRVVPSGQDGSILPARVANHSARFGSSCPLAELAI